MLRLYRMGIACVVWGALVPWHVCQWLLGRSRVSDLAERLGRPASIGDVSSARIVIHAVSVGEMHAASALVGALAERLPGHSFVLTCMTQEGRRIAERIRSEVASVESCVFLPWDRATAIETWLRQVGPRAVVIVETEIWPNLFNACREMGIPLFVASGRIYPKDITGYRLLRPFLRGVLDAVTWFGVQSEAEAMAFCRIGAPAPRLESVGNLKYDVPPANRRLPAGYDDALRDAQPLIIAGSTHAPEEHWLVSMLPSLCAACPGVRLVLAPRDIRRAASLRRLAGRSNLVVWSWSSGFPPPASWDVLVVNDMGWLATLYRFADVVVAGGTFAGRGGHTVVEAAAHGRAVVVGPFVSHIRQDVQDMAAREAIVWLPDRAQSRTELERALQTLLADGDARRVIGTRADEFVSSKAGAARRCADEIARVIDAGGRDGITTGRALV